MTELREKLSKILEKQTNANGASITAYVGKDGYVWQMIIKAMEEAVSTLQLDRGKEMSIESELIDKVEDFFIKYKEQEDYKLESAVTDIITYFKGLSLLPNSKETKTGVTDKELLQVESVLEENKRLKSELKAIRDTEKPILEKLTSFTKQLEEAKSSIEWFVETLDNHPSPAAKEHYKDLVEKGKQVLRTINTNSNG